VVEPLFRFDGKPVAGSELVLDGPEGHHAASVRRMRVGEAIQLTNGIDTHSRGVVLQVAPKSLTIRVDSVEAIQAPKLSFGLTQALAKGDRDELAIQAATELGATRITPWQAERSISRWDAAKTAKNIERWSTITSEAAKQALRPLFPVVAEPVTTKQLAAQANPNFLVLDPTAALSLSDWQAPTEGHIELIVGPEGGISEHELELLEKAGALRVHLGAGILRTSTAGMAALAFLAGRSGLWR
jgi:16S rRNA (uracil1498-N3)-methyltransferase